jgi:hypothetical protein
MSTTVHDSGYKRLFSNKTIFRQLIETFVEKEWAPKLDFDRAERLDKSFVSEHYKAQYRTREEMKSMLIKALEQARDTLRQAGYDLGKKEGKLEAQRQTLLHLLQWRFSPSAEEQAHYAAQLERIDNLEHLPINLIPTTSRHGFLG